MHKGGTAQEPIKPTTKGLADLRQCTASNAPHELWVVHEALKSAVEPLPQVARNKCWTREISKSK